jgi:hypothetical protein
MKPVFTSLLIFILLPALTSRAQTIVPHIIQQEFIFDTASFESCHASTIVSLGKNLLMSAWFGG